MEMTEHTVKKSSSVTILAMFILLSFIIAAQFPANQGKSYSTSDIQADQNNNLVFSEILGSAQNTTAPAWNKLSCIDSIHTTGDVPENTETISEAEESSETVATEEINQVSEGNKVIAVKPSTANEVQIAKTDSSVSRGTQNTNTVSNTGSNDIAHFWQNRKTWLQPVKGKQTADPTGGSRYFGASRSNGRVHAAIDFIAPGGTLVYAMTGGQVIRTSLFFENTYAVEVQNTDGTVARYCEISPAVSVGTIVQRGDVIGKIITNWAGTSMLHLEMYMGTSSGTLSQSNSSNYKYVTVRNYQRRSDLIDPTGAIYLPVK